MNYAYSQSQLSHTPWAEIYSWTLGSCNSSSEKSNQEHLSILNRIEMFTIWPVSGMRPGNQRRKIMKRSQRLPRPTHMKCVFSSLEKGLRFLYSFPSIMGDSCGKTPSTSSNKIRIQNGKTQGEAYLKDSSLSIKGLRDPLQGS